MELTSKEAFAKPRIKAVSLKSGDTAFVRSITIAQRLNWFGYLTGLAKDNKDSIEVVWGNLLRYALCDTNGTRIFNDTEPVEFGDSSIMEELFDVASEFNLLTIAAVDEEKKD